MPPLHGIIIPHRERVSHLMLCLYSIQRSARILGWPADRFQVYVAHHGEVPPPDDGAIVVWDRDPMPVFNKARLQNQGVKTALTAGCQVLSFLDADAIVGPRWLEAAQLALTHTMVAYRVRYAPWAWNQGPKELWDARLERLFAGYDELERGYEAYGHPDKGWTGGKAGAVIGNSQFTIGVDRLGDLRFDEGYVGRGFEDLDMLQALFCKHVGHWSNPIQTDGDHAIVCQHHGYLSDWKNTDCSIANKRRYRTKWKKSG